jgi:hypothetical protein
MWQKNLILHNIMQRYYEFQPQFAQEGIFLRGQIQYLSEFVTELENILGLNKGDKNFRSQG